MAALEAQAHGLDMAVLVEVHDGTELGQTGSSVASSRVPCCQEPGGTPKRFDVMTLY